MTKEHVELVAMVVCVAFVGLWVADAVYGMMTAHISGALGAMK